jgi:outer membrane protein assembly factor BamB
MKFLYTFVCICILCTTMSAQIIIKKMYESIGAIGLSATSIDTVRTKTLNFAYPVYQYAVDTTYNSFVFSTRLKSDDGKTSYNKVFLGTVDLKTDTLNWFAESNTYDLFVAEKSLFFSGDAKTSKLNKLRGFEEMKYPAKLIHVFPGAKNALIYESEKSNVVHGLNLKDFSVTYSVSIPREENWVDLAQRSDSSVIIAANGLHALDFKKGLLWSYSLTTSAKITETLVATSLENNSIIKNSSTVIKTSNDDISVTELSSNIYQDENGNIYFASKNKLLALEKNGTLLWEVDLSAYPISKMILSKNETSLTLINLGLARYLNNYAVYGVPFVLTVDLKTGSIIHKLNLGFSENLVDFMKTDDSFIFGSKSMIAQIKNGSNQLDTLLVLSKNKYEQFSEFINGNSYYAETEGVYVSLNFINNNPIYFKTDNNKVYGLNKKTVSYEYHFSEIFKLDKTFDNKKLLVGEGKSLVISNNAELLFSINLTDKAVLTKNKLIFVGEKKINFINTLSFK